MSPNFIRLTKYVINTKYIRQIQIQPMSYHINLYDSYPLTGFTLCGTGWISSNYIPQLNICSEKDPVDYEIIKKWMDKYISIEK